MEDKESLKSSTLVCQLSNSVQDKVNNLLANCIVAPCIVVCGILLSSDQLFWMKELPKMLTFFTYASNLIHYFSDLPVGSCSHFVHHRGFQIDKDGPGHMLARPSLREESIEGVVAGSQGLVRRHLAIGLDAMLQAVELPACIADLAARLANVDGEATTLK